MTYDLLPILYLYRGQLIQRTHCDKGHVYWAVVEEPGGHEVYAGESVDDCMNAVDDVIEDSDYDA
jgi:hypothetical protein